MARSDDAGGWPARDFLVETRSLRRDLGAGDARQTILHDVSLAIEEGEFVALTGTSGSGKSTLLYLLGALDRQTSGEIWLDGVEMGALDDDDRARFRNERLGFVFQFHFLLPEFTALENVILPILRRGSMARSEAEDRGYEALRALDLEELYHRKPGELSGGQQQRVSIARAVANDPALILADEPTGNLDSKNAEAVFQVFATLSREQGRTIVMVTHDADFAHRASRQIRLRDGWIVEDSVQPEFRSLGNAPPYVRLLRAAPKNSRIEESTSRLDGKRHGSAYFRELGLRLDMSLGGKDQRPRPARTTPMRLNLLRLACLGLLGLGAACSSPSEGPLGGPYTPISTQGGGSGGSSGDNGGSSSGSSSGSTNASSSGGSDGSSSGSSSGSTSGSSSGSSGGSSSSSGSSSGSTSGSSSGSSGGSSSSSGSSGGSSSSSGSSSGGTGAPTWTQLTANYLAAGTAGDCAKGGCHSECSTAPKCYQFISENGYLQGGINNSGLFTWTSGGFMPKHGPSSEPQAVTDFAAWTAAGAQDN